jgi:hypothetical protein
MGEKKLSKKDAINLTSIARDEHESIGRRINALNRISSSYYFHDSQQKPSLIRRVIERIIHLV